jgi:hypothetical protein
VKEKLACFWLPAVRRKRAAHWDVWKDGPECRPIMTRWTCSYFNHTRRAATRRQVAVWMSSENPLRVPSTWWKWRRKFLRKENPRLYRIRRWQHQTDQLTPVPVRVFSCGWMVVVRGSNRVQENRASRSATRQERCADAPRHEWTPPLPPTTTEVATGAASCCKTQW